MIPVSILSHKMSVTCNVHNSECVTQKHARCDAAMRVTSGGAKSHDCHHLYINVLIRTFYPRLWLNNCEGEQWLSGRVLDSRPKGCWFEPHRRHCVVSLSKNINPSLVLVQPRKTQSFITEILLMGRKESNQTNK